MVATRLGILMLQIITLGHPRAGLPIKIPALVVATRYDPMVPIETITPYTDVGQVTAIISDRGGHVGFPKDLDFGFGPELGLEAQIRGWLEDG